MTNVVAPERPPLPDTVLRDLKSAWWQVDAGWFGDALTFAARTLNRADHALGDRHEVTETVRAFHRAIAREHHNHDTSRIQEPALLRLAYLAALGAVTEHLNPTA